MNLKWSKSVSLIHLQFTLPLCVKYFLYLPMGCVNFEWNCPVLGKSIKIYYIIKKQNLKYHYKICCSKPFHMPLNQWTDRVGRLGLNKYTLYSLGVGYQSTWIRCYCIFLLTLYVQFLLFKWVCMISTLYFHWQNIFTLWCSSTFGY